MKHSILFIHGFAGGKYEYRPIIAFLKDHGEVRCYEFEYKKKFGVTSLKEIAHQLHEFITTTVIEPVIDVIALSQGGVIIRYYLAHYNDIHVETCITVCSPHHGSLLAYSGMVPGIRDLRPGSDFLKSLDTKKATYFTVYNPFDLMVIPGWSGMMEEAKENKRIFSLLHPLTFYSRKTYAFILSVLTR